MAHVMGEDTHGLVTGSDGRSTHAGSRQDRSVNVGHLDWLRSLDNDPRSSPQGRGSFLP
jgi:hypothetical protein